MHSHDLRWHIDETGDRHTRCRSCGVDGAFAVLVKCPASRPVTSRALRNWVLFAVGSVVVAGLLLKGFINA